MTRRAGEGRPGARGTAPHGARTAQDRAPFAVPALARGVVRLVRLVPALVTLAFAGWAVSAALAGEGATVAAASLMSLLALSVAVRAAIGANGLR